ncbi:16S rRNA (guanine(527)-N(7))-methyltransferase RsmG [Thioclava sp. GXIMD4216]|uniref:16S rRNA (guanine(527)-N(7))-methyltransferase RsmG n=1 Tax=Thioclava sp. GXIMD4216 TaxID=3131929 RepID=UPI0030CDF991
MEPNFLIDVSRETIERFEIYEALVKKWNPAINLVAKSTISQFQKRHLADSIQIYDPTLSWKRWVDLGSGGGLPGIVVAILAAQHNPAAQVHLVESDQRKCAFLMTCIRELSISAQVHSQRILDIPSLQADVISARALAALDMLLDFSTYHQRENAIFLFPKGVNWKSEVLEAQKSWTFKYEAFRSNTDPDATILKISGAERV